MLLLRLVIFAVILMMLENYRYSRPAVGCKPSQEDIWGSWHPNLPVGGILLDHGASQPSQNFFAFPLLTLEGKPGP